ncbi:MAG: Radical SAM domain protein [Parcubacteria group bacterium GW2011_GWA2_40_23]|nr:MAG: Radical SAM domain protein [Parcubacteria group bacterium GW2011_GWA2_40_23]
MAKLREVHWEVTNRCNLRCKTCLPMSGPPRPGELTTREVLAALEKLRLADVTFLGFTGGEPFRRPDFLFILTHAAALGFQVSVISNGTLLDDKSLTLVKKLKVRLGISLDGTNPSVNDRLRGPGTFEKVLQALKACQILSLPVQLYFTFNRINFCELPKLGSFVKGYGCQSLHISELTLGGRALQFAKLLNLTLEQKAKTIAVVTKLAKEGFNEKLSKPDDSCWLDGASLFLTADGRIYPCTEIWQRRPDFSLGNIRSYDLARWPNFSGKRNVLRGNCCYSVLGSKRITLVINNLQKCAFFGQTGKES